MLIFATPSIMMENKMKIKTSKYRLSNAKVTINKIILLLKTTLNRGLFHLIHYCEQYNPYQIS